MRILIVDDDYTSRCKLKALMAQYGDVDAVPNGRLALDMFEAAHREGVPYNLTTLDVEMPGMGGLELARRLRKIEMQSGVRIAEETKLLTVTVRQDSGTVLSSVKSGSEYYLVKPVGPDNLRTAMEKLGFVVERKEKPAVAEA